MSYSSVNKLPKSIKLGQLKELVALLGYIKARDGLKLPNRIGSWYWFEAKDYQSYTGVELDIYLEPDQTIQVTTRTPASRSHWDLIHQNKTIKLIKELFGGTFETDAGPSRCQRPHGRPPSPLASGCYLAHWRFRNDLIRAQLYLNHRKLEGQLATNAASGFAFLDEMNPRLLSNNILLPYLVAAWEEYFRQTFVAAMKYSKDREKVFKRAQLNATGFELIASGQRAIELVIAESFTFQRPSRIGEYFRLLDPRIDMTGALRKPWRNRKTSLFDSIEKLVEDRNEFVHSGRMNLTLFDAQLKLAISDMKTGVDRAYKCISDHYRFVPMRAY